MLRAAERADALLEEGDLKGQRLWLRVLEAIHEMRHPVRRPDQLLN